MHSKVCQKVSVMELLQALLVCCLCCILNRVCCISDKQKNDPQLTDNASQARDNHLYSIQTNRGPTLSILRQSMERIVKKSSASRLDTTFASASDNTAIAPYRTQPNVDVTSDAHENELQPARHNMAIGKRSSKIKLHENCVKLLRGVRRLTLTILKKLYICSLLEVRIENKAGASNEQRDSNDVDASGDGQPRHNDVRPAPQRQRARSRIMQYIKSRRQDSDDVKQRPRFQPSAW